MNPLDTSLVLTLNQAWAHPFLDVVFGWLSSKTWFSFPLLFCLLLVFIRQSRDKLGVKFWVAMVLAVGIGDVSGNLIKHTTLMERPCQTMPEQIRLVSQPFKHGCARKPHGMPSNHSLNFFLAATMSGILLRSWSWGLGLGILALLVAVSRVYLGVHYPSQVLAGAFLGCLLGVVLAWLTLKITTRTAITSRAE